MNEHTTIDGKSDPYMWTTEQKISVSPGIVSAMAASFKDAGLKVNQADIVIDGKTVTYSVMIDND